MRNTLGNVFNTITVEQDSEMKFLSLSDTIFFVLFIVSVLLFVKLFRHFIIVAIS